jgi:hypothetical protein
MRRLAAASESEGGSEGTESRKSGEGTGVGECFGGHDGIEGSLEAVEVVFRSSPVVVEMK